MTPAKGALSGELQRLVMAAVWELGSATVEDVRGHLLPREPAYNTVQTILNRLLERGLLRRARSGAAYRYEAVVQESELLAESLAKHLANASDSARRVALTNLVGELSEEDLQVITKYAAQIQRERK